MPILDRFQSRGGQIEEEEEEEEEEDWDGPSAARTERMCRAAPLKK
jgi:hypothetical protein